MDEWEIYSCFFLKLPTFIGIPMEVADALLIKQRLFFTTIEMMKNHFNLRF